MNALLAYGQQSKVEEIAAEVELIENNTSLTLEEYDLSKILGNNYDGGAVLKVWHHDKIISKIYEEIGLSSGRLKTTFYIKNNTIIKIIETEETFLFVNNEIDLTNLEEVFLVDIFVFGQNKNIQDQYDFELKRIGHRVNSDGFCELSDFFSSVNRAEKAIIK